ncbi:hypothetical protein LIT25_23935 [Bacillus sp. F19]|nr:hypothetical protein LIT25_23935 [Bacillus sp. F19]
MKKIKENRSAKLAARVTKSLKDQVIEFAEMNGDLSESKAVEILLIKALRK